MVDILVDERRADTLPRLAAPASVLEWWTKATKLASFAWQLLQQRWKVNGEL